LEIALLLDLWFNFVQLCFIVIRVQCSIGGFIVAAQSLDKKFWGLFPSWRVDVRSISAAS